MHVVPRFPDALPFPLGQGGGHHIHHIHRIHRIMHCRILSSCMQTQTPQPHGGDTEEKQDALQASGSPRCAFDRCCGKVTQDLRMPANKPSNKPVSSCVNSAGRNDRLLAETIGCKLSFLLSTHSCEFENQWQNMAELIELHIWQTPR